MSDDVTDTGAAATAVMDNVDDPKPVKPIPPAEIFRFLRENFTVISGLAVVGGIALATIFLSSYLAVFDWHLLWFVQYTDILTYGLIALGLVGGSFLLVQPLTQTALSFDALQEKSRRKWRIALPIIFLALLAIELYGAIKHGDGYFHILFGAIVIGVGVVLILLLLNYVRFAIWPTAKQAAALVILSALSAGTETNRHRQA